MTDKQFYKTLLEQLEDYLKKNPGCYMYLCVWVVGEDRQEISRFGRLCAKRLDKRLGCALTIPQRRFVVKEAIRYCKSKIN
jgi:hypothetical protein